MIAYLTAEQLDAHGPDACPPQPAGSGYVANDDGSNPMVCRIARRRIDPAIGVCGYHQELGRRGRARLVTPFAGPWIVAAIPVHPYPLLQEAARP